MASAVDKLPCPGSVPRIQPKPGFIFIILYNSVFPPFFPVVVHPPPCPGLLHDLRNSCLA